MKRAPNSEREAIDLRRLIYSAAARRSLGEFLEYLTIEMGSEARARPIVSRIKEQCRKIAALPTILGRPRHELSPGLRSFPFQGYVIFMRYSEDTLEIVNILHSRRDTDAIMDENEH
jgi:toxin ParE1/3/4